MEIFPLLRQYQKNRPASLIREQSAQLCQEPAFPPGDLHLCGTQPLCCFALGLSIIKPVPNQQPILFIQLFEGTSQRKRLRDLFLLTADRDVELRGPVILLYRGQ